MAQIISRKCSILLVLTTAVLFCVREAEAVDIGSFICKLVPYSFFAGSLLIFLFKYNMHIIIYIYIARTFGGRGADCKIPCLYGGVCYNGNCFCKEGFFGEDCSNRLENSGSSFKSLRKAVNSVKGNEADSCPNACNGNGICVEGKCFCDESHVGSDCGRSLCSKGGEVNDCFGRGVCENGACKVSPISK